MGEMADDALDRVEEELDEIAMYGGLRDSFDSQTRWLEGGREMSRPIPQNFDSYYAYKCKNCGTGIHFTDRKPFDRNGLHRCYATFKEKQNAS